MTIPAPRQFEPLAAVPIVSGLFWLLGGSGLWMVFALVPGVLTLATGVGLLLWPGERRQIEYLAMASIVGVVLALPAMVAASFGLGACCLVLSVCCYLVAGRLGLRIDPLADGMPALDHSIVLDAKAALDEALLGYFVGTAIIPSGAKAERMCVEAFKLEKILHANGWQKNTDSFHREPPPPERSELAPGRIYGHEFERLTYRSGFIAHDELPGAQAWANHHANNESAAWLLRHKTEERRPWLLCIHGYRMGHAWMDFGLFPPGWLHHKLGLNLMMPVLPLHGSRRIGPRSGDQYLDGDMLDLLHAQTQALWDLRRAIRWIREQEPDARIGVLGYSLGGYNTALLATVDEQLDFVVAGIPVADFATTTWRHLPPQHQRYFEGQGLDVERYRRILSVVSPLEREPRISADRRYIFAGAADRVVVPEHPLRLSAHWNVPVQWYQGGHLTFRREFAVRAHIEAAMQRAGWPVSARVRPTPGNSTASYTP